MLQLEGRNKISLLMKNDGSWYESEDVLFALVFGTAIYLPFNAFLGPILKIANPVYGNKKFPFVSLTNVLDYHAELWPTFKQIYEYNPKLINITESGRSEPDAFCEIDNNLLIIEAKALNAPFKEDQLQKYLEALSADKSKTLWLLAVGKGKAVLDKLCSFQVAKKYRILYVSWTSIHAMLIDMLSNNSDYTHRLFIDLEKNLRKRPLKPFEGFQWPEGLSKLENDKKHNNNYRDKWFPHFPKEWPISLSKPLKFEKLIDLPLKLN
jgi:hypothetical protein